MAKNYIALYPSAKIILKLTNHPFLPYNVYRFVINCHCILVIEINKNSIDNTL